MRCRSRFKIGSFALVGAILTFWIALLTSSCFMRCRNGVHCHRPTVFLWPPVLSYAILFFLFLLASDHLFSHTGDPNKEQVLKAPLKTLMPFMSNLLDVLLFSDIMTEAVGAFDPRDKTPLAPSERRKLQENLQRQHQDQEQQQPHQYYSEEQSARYV